MAKRKTGREKVVEQIRKVGQKHKKKKSAVRHTRAIQRDRSKRQLAAPPDEKIKERMAELVTPDEAEEKIEMKRYGLRLRKLSLSVMIAIVISLIWRHIGSGGSEAARLLHLEGLLWVSAMSVSQQAISERLRTFPARLFFEVVVNRLGRFEQRSQARDRPLPPALAWAVLAADGSTLDALLRKVGLLRDEAKHPLAGKLMTLLNVSTLLPQAIWFDPNPRAHDQRFWPRLTGSLPAGALLLLDMGFTNFEQFRSPPIQPRPLYHLHYPGQKQFGL